MEDIYSTPRWRNITRPSALRRDGHRCTVARLLGGACAPGPLHVHHIIPVADGGPVYDLDNVGTSCAKHHPQWEALRRALVKRLRPERKIVRCPHQHRSSEARRLCEARLNREREEAAA